MHVLLTPLPISSVSALSLSTQDSSLALLTPGIELQLTVAHAIAPNSEVGQAMPRA
jgi:hypothetical protein